MDMNPLGGETVSVLIDVKMIITVFLEELKINEISM